MRAVHASWRDLPPEPWKNGGGVTRTLAVDDAVPASACATADAAAPRWRVSVADIDRDGAYSRFPGYDRVSVVLSGAGVALQGDGVNVTLRPGVPTGFPGDAALQSRLLDGPVRVLNLFVLRSAAQASVRCAQARPAAAACTAAIPVMAGSLEDAIGVLSDLRITVADGHFHIDLSCPGDARAGEGLVEQDLSPGAVRMVLRMAAPMFD